ncbi:transcription factor bHLH18-like [Eucalyptus grandis]|uniref:transcription factor bHLH18-like n=1 Tax=Eucalyptus grandis TaxID=71139 RepID=UPI00192E8B63|nr:transcription factor bHLH18-like [Eucalyptus grandis]
MVEDAANFHHQQQQYQQRLNSSFLLNDEFDLLHPHFSSEPYSNSSPSYPLPLISSETVPHFAARSVETPQSFTERPWKQLKTKSWNSTRATEDKTVTCNSPSQSRSPDSRLISFGNPESSLAMSNPFFGTYEIQDREGPQMRSAGTTSRMAVRPPDHMLAERKRREKLSQHFIALSAVIPNLKKRDKSSVLEDAIKYLKELQRSVKTLEEEAAVKTVESVVMVRKSQPTMDANSFSQGDQQLSLPEIEARVSGKCVLIKIHCKKRNGFLLKMIGEIEKMNLTVVNSCVLPFGTSILDVTILAQMDAEYSMKMGDLVRNLRRAFPEFM